MDSNRVNLNIGNYQSKSLKQRNRFAVRITQSNKVNLSNTFIYTIPTKPKLLKCQYIHNTIHILITSDKSM